MPEPLEVREPSAIGQRTEYASRVLRGPVAGQYGGEALAKNGKNAYEYHPAETPRAPVEMPLISVVVPTYNRADFLRDAIDSILDQDYPNIECIVVDAGSTDGSIEVLKTYGERITWVSRPDKGAFDAINDGWRASKGEILAWVNSDDVWDPGSAEFAARYFQDHPDIDVLYGACGAIDEHGNLTDEYPPRPWDLRFALENCDHIINQTASYMRREIIEKVGFLYPAWCHDHDLWLRIAAAGGTFGTTPQRLGSARMWPDNLGNNPKIIVPGKVGLTKRFFATEGLPSSIRKLRRRSLSNSYLRCMFYVSPTQPKNWLIGVKLMLQAMWADPPNSFYLVGQIGRQLVRRTPLPDLLHGLKSMALGALGRLRSLLHLLLVQPFVALFAAVGSLVRAVQLRAVIKAVAPVAALAIAAGLALSADLGIEAAARTFVYISIPLLATIALYDHRS
jgi:glycosyltransferase involved in cell wall biosynthesis